MKKYKKIIVFILIILVSITITTKVYGFSIDKIIADAEEFLGIGMLDSTVNEGKLQQSTKEIYGVVYSIALVIMIGVGMILGIKFIMATVEEKAKIKELLIPYVCGVIVIFGTFGIWKMVVDMGLKIDENISVSGTNAEALWEIAKNKYTISGIDELIKNNRKTDFNNYVEELKNVKLKYKEELKTPPDELEERIIYVGILQNISNDVIEYAKEKKCTFGGVYETLYSEIYAHYNPKNTKKIRQRRCFFAKSQGNKWYIKY